MGIQFSVLSTDYMQTESIGYQWPSTSPFWLYFTIFIFFCTPIFYLQVIYSQASTYVGFSSFSLRIPC